MKTKECDLAVIGAGSGGIGAALAGARLGLRVLLVEKADQLGGTAVLGGVNVWEPGAGGTGIPFEIYKRLKEIPDAVGIYSRGRHRAWQRPDEPVPFPGGERVIDPQRRYAHTLRRHGRGGTHFPWGDEAFAREIWHGVPFEPEAYSRTVEKMLNATRSCTVWKNTSFADVGVEERRITSLHLAGGRQISAAFYVDATGDGLLALAAGCRMMMGQEAQEAFNEPHAPDERTDHLNAATLVFRVTPTDKPGVEPRPEGVAAECWWRDQFPSSCVTQYPCGDLNVNMLPTMEGREAFDLGHEPAYAECLRRVRAHWHHSQTIFPEFRNYRLSWIAPALGVRETRRVVSRYVLNENDLLAGLSGQKHDDIIAIADHAMDTHGSTTGRAGCMELSQPYGVPFRCLLPTDVDNLMVACRAAGLSSLAASSCRLSRTMMQLGQAAGAAAAIAKRLGHDLADIPADQLRQALRDQHVQLEWPAPDELHEYLMAE